MPRVVRLCCPDFRSGSTGAAAPPTQNYSDKIPPSPPAAGSDCVICVELCRIRSASFGPIRKQIKAMWAQAHTAGSWDSGSRVNRGPACPGTAHPWRDVSHWTMTDTPQETGLKQGLAKFYYIWPVSIDCWPKEDHRLCHQFCDYYDIYASLDFVMLPLSQHIHGFNMEICDSLK